MSLVIGDIIKITMFWIQNQIEAVTVGYFRYTAADIPPTYAELAEGFGKHQMINTNLGAIIKNDAFLERVVVDNFSNGLEFGEALLHLVGSAGGGGAEPSFVAPLLKQVRETKLTRNGYKRFPFMDETMVNGNALTLPATPKENIEADWGSEQNYAGNLTVGTYDFDLQPVIVGRTLVDGVYVPDPLKINEVTGAQFVRVTSQNSRKS